MGTRKRLSMKIEQSSDECRWNDVNLVDEIDTISRLVFDSFSDDDGADEKVRVFHRPDETLGEILDDDEWEETYRTPVETTVLVVDEDELITRERIRDARNV